MAVTSSHLPFSPQTFCPQLIHPSSCKDGSYVLGTWKRRGPWGRWHWGWVAAATAAHQPIASSSLVVQGPGEKQQPWTTHRVAKQICWTQSGPEPTLQCQALPTTFPFLVEGLPRSDSFEACLRVHGHNLHNCLTQLPLPAPPRSWKFFYLMFDYVGTSNLIKYSLSAAGVLLTIF